MQEQSAGLETEILQEMAEALGNAGIRVEQALDRIQSSKDRIEDLKRRLEASPQEAQRQVLQNQLRDEIDRYNALREEAITHYRNLIIHREAVGFRKHKLMEEKYRIPERMEISVE